METISILDRNFTVAYNFNTMIYDEEIHGKVADLSSLDTFKAQIEHCHMVLSACNDDMPSLEDFRANLSMHEFNLLSAAVTREMNHFFRIPDTAPKKKKGDKEGKNL